MKKYIKIIILLITVFILCACKTKQQYELIEITSAELIDTVLSENKVDLIYALYNPKVENSQNFLEDLKKVASAIQTNIYYIDVNHIDVESYATLSSSGGLDTNINAFFAIKNGTVISSGEYSDYQKLYLSLNSLNCKSEIRRQTSEEKEIIFSEAKKAYQNGDIVYSLDLINKVWDMNEAKEFYNNSNYFNIINFWEFYEFKDSEMTDLTYTSILFYKDITSFFQIEERTKYDENFQKPTIDKYEQLYYYIKDGIIYTSKTFDGTYKEYYKINHLDNKQLILTRIKDQKEYKYILRS